MNTKAIEALLIALAFALFTGTVWVKASHHGAAGVQAKWDADKASRQTVVVTKLGDKITTDRAEDVKAEKVDAHVQDQIKIVTASVVHLSAVNRSLLDTLGAVRADAMSQTATRARLAAEAAAAADSLGECSQRYSEVAEKHDAMSVQVSGLLELLPPP